MFEIEHKSKIENSFRYSNIAPMSDTLYNLDILIREHLFENRAVVIFGANGFAERITSRLDKEGLRVCCIIDNDKRKQGTEMNGLSIISPESLNVKRNETIILISSAYFKEMCEQLKRLGWDRESNIVKLSSINRANLSVTIKDTKRIARGLFFTYCYSYLYTKLIIRKKMVFLAPVVGLGDYYYIFGYLKDYCKRNNIVDYVVLCLTDAGRRIGMMFDIPSHRIIRVKSKGMDKLIRYSNVFGENDTKVKVLHWVKRHGEVLTEMHKNSELFRVPFNKAYELAGYGERLHFEYPRKYNNSAEIVRVLDENGLRKGKTVVISPDSNTIVSIPMTFWRKLVKKIQARRLDICTNLSSKNGVAIDGTKGVYLPIDLMECFCDEAGFFCGSRSGLCDVISGGNSKKVIIYNDSYRLKNIEEVFSFNKMGVGKNIQEIMYKKDEENRIVDETIMMLGL